MFIFYDLIMFTVGFFYLPYLLFRLATNPSWVQGFGMRLGILPKDILQKLSSKETIWLHAVSVGEVMGAETLVESLRLKFPNHRLVISTVTQTGNRVAKRLASRDDVVIYFPLDLSFIVKRMIRKISPRIFLMVETEIWPNFITAAFKEEIPVILVNGRISPRSFKKYRKVRFFLKKVLEKINLFLMQTSKEKAKIISLGAPPDRVKVTGNMKFDQAKLSGPSEEGIARLRDSFSLAENEELFVAGSTHPGEEEIILEAYKTLRLHRRNLRLLLAPRHPERAPQIEKLVTKHGFVPFRVSQLPSPQSQALPSASSGPLAEGPRANAKGNSQLSILILDTIGQLRSIYGLADLVFVGGSLVPRGGHNPIEPACLGKPILFGPWLFNFQAIADAFLEKGAAILVKDKEDLEAQSLRLLGDPSKRKELGAKAKEVVELSLGATKRNIDLVKELFDKKRTRE